MMARADRLWPATWAARKYQLIAERRLIPGHIEDVGKMLEQHRRPQYPHFLAFLHQAHAPFVRAAQRETAAPVHLSEEWYADRPQHVLLYAEQPGNLSDFWRAYDREKAAAQCECSDCEAVARILAPFRRQADGA